MFDYRMWLAPYLAIIFLVCCCLVTTCFAQMYANKDTKKGGEIELKASERKKIRKKNRKSSPYGSTDKTNASNSVCTSETQTSLPYYAEYLTEKTADGADHQYDQEDGTLNENDNPLTDGDGHTNPEEVTQDDDTYDNNNEISLNFKKSELEKENCENLDVMEVNDSEEKDNSSTDAVIQNRATHSESTKNNKSELEKENKNIKNSEMTEAISSKITVDSSEDGAVCVD